MNRCKATSNPFVLIILIIFSVLIKAGQAQVSLNLQLPPPGNFNPEDFSTLASFNNMSTAPLHVRMSATIEVVPGILIFSGETGVFGLEPGFSTPHYSTYEPVNIEYIDAEYEAYVISANNLPPGEYVICIRLLDAEMGEELAHECVTHTVFMPSAPVLVAPADGDVINEPMPVFTWLPPAPQPPVDFYYHIKVVEVHAAQSSWEALMTNPAFFEESQIMTNSLPYPAYAPQFSSGSSYAWQVQTLMGEGLPIGENEGISEASQFNYSSQLDTDFRVWIEPEGEFDDWAEASICFIQVDESDITYEIYFSGRDCDSLVVEKPHPFEAALPDKEYQNKLRKLNNGISNASRQYEYWLEYCEETQVQNRNKLERSLNTVNQRLEALRNMAAEISSEINFSLPTDCDVEDPCCNGQACCEGLDPCDPDDIQTYIDRMRCLNSQAVSFMANSNTHASEFIRLLNRWRSGAGHRATMDFYHWWFSLVDDIFSFAFDALDWVADELEFDAAVEHIITKIIKETLKEGVCVMDQEWCDAIEAAQSAKDKLETIRSLLKNARANGTMPPAFIFKMTQAMYQQAAGATGTAVEGWDNFAREMADHLKEAYRNQLCLKMIIEKQLADMDECADFCDQIVECYRNMVEKLTAEKDKLVSDRKENREQALADFEDLMNKMGEDLKNIPDGFVDECCTGETITMGEGSRCGQLLQTYLMEKYGDVVCYIRLEMVCNEENGEISFSIQYQIMNSRREDCCGPLAPFRELIGEQSGNNQGQEDQCYPETPRERDDFNRRMRGQGSGSAEVIARRPNGEIAGSGSTRGGPRPGGSSVPIPDNDTIICECTLEVLLNGTPTASGATFRNIKPGTPFNVQTNGSCDPCPPGNINITRHFVPLPLANGGLMQLPPQQANNSMQGTYNLEGLYSFTIELVCDDGTECKSDFSVLVLDDVPYVVPPDIELPQDAPYHCGSEPCLEVYLSLSGENQFAKDQFNKLQTHHSGKHDLRLVSNCAQGCAPDRRIRWEIDEPNGNKAIYENINLYNITHDFNQIGDYYICVFETARYNGGSVTASKYVIVVNN